MQPAGLLAQVADGTTAEYADILHGSVYCRVTW